MRSSGSIVEKLSPAVKFSVSSTPSSAEIETSILWLVTPSVNVRETGVTPTTVPVRLWGTTA